MIKGNNMNLAFKLEKIYVDAEFQLGDMDKVGIVGVNGAGKTTLFRLLLGEIKLDSGALSIGNARIGYLPQEVVLDDEDITVFDFLSEGRPIKKYQRELDNVYEALTTATDEEQAKLLTRMSKIQNRLDYFESYEAEAILLDLVDNMGIDIELFDRQMKELSGGQKSKIAFARLLYAKPEILLLDEPTNHLDIATKKFITKYLKNYKGSVLIISHDIAFLNQIITKTLHIDKVTHQITVYNGNYDVYKKKYTETKRLQNLAIDQQEKEIQKLGDFVQKAKQASQTNHHLKQMGLERAQRLEKKQDNLQQREQVYKRVKMDIHPQREGAKIPLKIENLTFHYPGQPILYEDLSVKIKGNERFLVVGENGVGKSTFLKLILGLLKPDKGQISFSARTDIAYYAQELEGLDKNRTVIENVEMEGYTEKQLRGVLSNFLFYDNDVYKEVSILSPGEKARVALCKVILQKANLLILDEPTNHLDPETQKIIGANFNLFEGTIIAVSHNLSFVEQIGITRMLILPSGQIKPYSRKLMAYYETNL